MKCRVIPMRAYSSAMNMAIDETLASNCTEPILRFYTWDPVSISIGMNQNVHKELNLDACKEEGVEVVRRISGGKAVLHDSEVTYSFILPEESVSLPKDVVESYRIIAQALVLAFKELGVDVEIQKQAERVATAVCFQSANWYELLADGKKISGSAQRRLKGVILQHGPIPLNFDYEKNAKYFNANAQILKDKITSLKALGIQKTEQDIVNAMKKGFSKQFSFDLVEEGLTNEELSQAQQLCKEKYATDKWNLRTAE